MDEEELIVIRDTIEKMQKFNQTEILRIIYSNVGDEMNLAKNENHTGIYINLSLLNGDIIDKLKKYIEYVNTQEEYLNQIEQEKENFKNTYFTAETTG
jgi:hypothetical protein